MCPSPSPKQVAGAFMEFQLLANSDFDQALALARSISCRPLSLIFQVEVYKVAFAHEPRK